MRKFLSAFLALGLLVAAARLAAQPSEAKPGPEHGLLKDSAGVWDAVIKSMGNESKGTLSAKLDLNGLWLLEHFKCDFGGMGFEGRGASTFDQNKKKYVNIWIDSMSTSPMISEGTFDKSTKTLTMHGLMTMPDGKTSKATLTTTMKDSNTKTFAIQCAGPDGKDFEMMHITYTRRAK